MTAPDLPAALAPDARLPAEPWNDPKATPLIKIRNVIKRFDGFVAVDDVWLDIYKGEFFSLLGPSGCGKTTLLRLLAGFEQPTSGTIEIDGVDMAGVPPHRRPVNMMFQSYALFPHMTVEQNVGFGLKQEHVSRREISRRVGEMLELVQLADLGRRRPHQLSGGQKQRVALARALIKRPKLLLLDEPLGALDRRLREQTQFELVNIQETLGLTFIIVTHDQDEAMTVSTRIAIMDRGRTVQVGTPGEIYEYPNSLYVAGFVGDVNVFEGRVVEAGKDHVTVRSPESGCDIYTDRGIDAVPGQEAYAAIRPEKIEIGKAPPADARFNCVTGRVFDIAYLGSLSTYHVRLATGEVVKVSAANRSRLVERPITWEDQVWLWWPPSASVVLLS
ncbi:putrescine transporter subunit: ATP-binding component of ABC superfamily [uncultured Defluviicoccus sp.]|uniref:Putrescine transporter subunit: ATP-binding component of ABC superfamily n=1 Tax=metagenome TaxID=256318 RepID=A0A380TGF5_9ZZZZ|nr:putrescine transporter subunit: ATP-binding component of ABC superfamily [uncultured Defluviicoccus sp.]HRW59180.1 polyamine ABC transporter ATP-binding protein [Defluviicoccus sp.]